MFDTKQSKIVLGIIIVVLVGLFGSQVVIYTSKQMEKGVATLNGKHKEYSPELIERMKKNNTY